MNFFKKFSRVFSFVDNFLFSLPVIGRRLYLRQLLRFIIAGGLVTILDFIIYIFLTRIFNFWQTHYLWANFIAMSIAAIVGFYFNKHWVFKNKGKKVFYQYLKFWIIGGIGGMVFYQYLFFVFTESAYMYDILAKALTAIIILFFRFAIQKFWVFK